MIAYNIKTLHIPMLEEMFDKLLAFKQKKKWTWIEFIQHLLEDTEE